MDIDRAVTILRDQLRKTHDWQKVAIFTTEAVEALVAMAEKEIAKENSQPINYYDK